jgi:uncharacterized protein (DUF2141 family)
MFKKAILFLAVPLMVSAFAYAEEKFTVSGEVSFQHDGDIYICLLTAEEFVDFHRLRHKLSESPCKVIHMSTDLKKAGKVSFTFDNTAKGTYCVLAYQDVNMNGEVDHAGQPLNEPWGSYKEPSQKAPGAAVWGTVKFDLEKDITGIKIEM